MARAVNSTLGGFVTPHQQYALAHIGGALLAAQIVERLLDILLAPAGESTGGTRAYEFMPMPERRKALYSLLESIRANHDIAPQLEEDLSSLLQERNKLAHCIPSLGSWNLQTEMGCSDISTFLKGFIERAARVQGNLVSVLSARDKLPGFDSKESSMRLAKDIKQVYSLVSVRWLEEPPSRSAP